MVLLLLPQDGHVDTHLWSMGCLGRRVGAGEGRRCGVSGWAGGLSGQTGVINLAVQPSFACMISSFRFLSLPATGKCSRKLALLLYSSLWANAFLVFYSSTLTEEY